MYHKKGPPLLPSPMDQPWKSGLCSAQRDCSLCCFACCCPSFQFGSNYEKLKSMEKVDTVLDNFVTSKDRKLNDNGSFILCIPPAWIAASVDCFLRAGGCLGLFFSGVPHAHPFIAVASACSVCSAWGLHAHIRRQVREANGVRGSCCSDTCAVVCCYSCALMQELKELNYLRNHTEMPKSQFLRPPNMMYE